MAQHDDDVFKSLIFEINFLLCPLGIKGQFEDNCKTKMLTLTSNYKQWAILKHIAVDRCTSDPQLLLHNLEQENLVLASDLVSFVWPW